jgi:hypothetical protein
VQAKGRGIQFSGSISRGPGARRPCACLAKMKVAGRWPRLLSVGRGLKYYWLSKQLDSWVNCRCSPSELIRKFCIIYTLGCLSGIPK